MSSGSEFAESQGFSAQERALPPPETEAQASRAEPLAQAVPQPQAVPQMIVAKNPAVGVILSFFIPGLGSMVSGNVGRGVLILGVYALGWLLTLILIGIPILIGAWIWGMVDGYLSAQRWNQAHGIVS